MPMNILIGTGDKLTKFALSKGGQKLIAAGARIVALPDDYSRLVRVHLVRTSDMRDKDDARATEIVIQRCQISNSNFRVWRHSIISGAPWSRNMRHFVDTFSCQRWDVLRIKINTPPPHYKMVIVREVPNSITRDVKYIERTVQIAGENHAIDSSDPDSPRTGT